jgi:hypothetical protein
VCLLKISEFLLSFFYSKSALFLFTQNDKREKRA